MSLIHESRLTLHLAFPLIIGQLSQMLLGVADTLMVGHLGVTELAALTFANSLFYLPFVFGIGLLTGVSVFTSNSRGAEDLQGARSTCRHGLYLSLILGVILFALAWVISLNLEIFEQPESVTARTPVYFRILMASMIPALASLALKNHADALNRPWPPFWIFLGGVGMNVVLNWIMIHGKLGCPAFGFEGAAWATLISRVTILLGMFGWLYHEKSLREWVPYRWLVAIHWKDFKRLIAVGFPASIQMGCEVSAFSLAGLMMGHFGSAAMAAHQIAITLAGMAFMIPLGLSMALTVRIGEADGANEPWRLRPIAVSGWLLGAGCALLSATCFFSAGDFLASLFTKQTDARSAQVVTMAASLLVIVGVFQIFDSLQVCSSAMLRGLQDTRVPAMMGFAAYWIFGLPISYGLAYHFNYKHAVYGGD
ncbi:MAG: MATE family efflux transporter [Akkermansiaceae bacterium]|nr:MATE family efflux transporter [Akkermansiaceae bacterium]